MPFDLHIETEAKISTPADFITTLAQKAWRHFAELNSDAGLGASKKFCLCDHVDVLLILRTGDLRFWCCRAQSKSYAVSQCERSFIECIARDQSSCARSRPKAVLVPHICGNLHRPDMPGITRPQLVPLRGWRVEIMSHKFGCAEPCSA